MKSCVSPDDKFLISGSSDNTAVIYDLSSHMSRSFRLNAHSEEVTSVAWSKYDVKKVRVVQFVS